MRYDWYGGSPDRFDRRRRYVDGLVVFAAAAAAAAPWATVKRLSE